MIYVYKNINVYYNDTGQGKAVVLLHGFLETSEMWNAIVSELLKTNRVICIDLLGHGQTGSLGYIHTMETMSDVVYAVLNHLRIDKAKFVGHSMGGYVALALAEKHAQLFDGLCLMNSTFEADDAERKILRARANDMAKINYENLVHMSFTNLFAAESRIRCKQDFDMALHIAQQTSVQGYIAAQKGMAIRPDRYHALKNVSGKKLIVIGKKDTLINREYIQNKIKNTTIACEELSEGHMSHIENKSELTYILIRFVEN